MRITYSPSRSQSERRPPSGAIASPNVVHFFIASPLKTFRTLPEFSPTRHPDCKPSARLPDSVRPPQAATAQGCRLSSGCRAEESEVEAEDQGNTSKAGRFLFGFDLAPAGVLSAGADARHLLDRTGRRAR